MHKHFQMFANYNKWANSLLYAEVSKLTPEEFCQDRQVFFNSMMGTLNHLLVGDYIWMHRFSNEGNTYNKLDIILHEDFSTLKSAREKMDMRIIDFIDDLSNEKLKGRFTFTTVTDIRTISQRLSPALSHFFNHQTHHRGQAHALLSQFGKETPSLDLLYFQRHKAGIIFA